MNFIKVGRSNEVFARFIFRDQHWDEPFKDLAELAKDVVQVRIGKRPTSIMHWMKKSDECIVVQHSRFSLGCNSF